MCIKHQKVKKNITIFSSRLLPTECYWASTCRPLYWQIKDRLFPQGMQTVLWRRNEFCMPRFRLSVILWDGWSSRHNWALSIREIGRQSEVLNCDLSEKNTSLLDPYNNEHFVVNAVTDFYDRIDIKAASGDSSRDASDGCFDGSDFISGSNQKIDTNAFDQRLQPQRGNDDVEAVIVEFPSANHSGLTFFSLSHNFSNLTAATGISFFLSFL